MLARIEAASSAYTSPVAVYETTVAFVRLRHQSFVDARARVSRLLADLVVDIVPITNDIADGAIQAFERYGKGRGHPAQLNMGDCFAYACAKSLGVPLLYKGDDFSQTDLA